MSNDDNTLNDEEKLLLNNALQAAQLAGTAYNQQGTDIDVVYDDVLNVATTASISPEDRQDAYNELYNVLSRRYGYQTMALAPQDVKSDIRSLAYDFFHLIGNVNTQEENLNLHDNLDYIPQSSIRLARIFQRDPELLDEMLRIYVQTMKTESGRSNYTQAVELRGNKVNAFIKALIEKLPREGEDYGTVSQYDSLQDAIAGQLRVVGDDFRPIFEHIDYKENIKDYITNLSGKFRRDSGPSPIARWQCRLGLSTFPIPPTSINVSQEFFTGSLTGGAIRQANSPKTNIGHSDTVVRMTLIFPNHQSIWGYDGDKMDAADLSIFDWSPDPSASATDSAIFGIPKGRLASTSDAKIDRYMSSLRGLITQFKYSPILPISNEYLNRTYGISAVALSGISLSTVEGFPFVVAVNIELKKFNFKPFMPMIQNFNQAIHWGKFRMYAGKAAASMEEKTSERFLKYKESDLAALKSLPDSILGQSGQSVYDELVDETLPSIPRLDKSKDILEGKNFEFYYPRTTPSRIFAPDTTDFRQVGEGGEITEGMWTGFIASIGLRVGDAPEYDFFEYSNSRRGRPSERKLVNDWVTANRLSWAMMNSDMKDRFISEAITQGQVDGSVNESNREFVASQLNAEWYYYVFTELMNSSGEIEKARKRIEESNNYIIKEWELDMDKLYVNWDNVIVNGVSVGMKNNFARMQVNLQEDPTYQFIGGGDSIVNVSMTIMGEEDLIRLRRMYEHINGLARIERGFGTLGFLGIKNLLTTLCGIKYVLPLSWNVDTVPNFPHVYQLQMSFVDFDIRQQEREKISSEVQKKLVKSFSKRNPFLRIKQAWNVYNAYPEFPLEIRNEAGELLGYMDPDWYFRSFMANDRDVYEWNMDNDLGMRIVEMNDYNKALAALDKALKNTDDQERAKALTAQMLVAAANRDSIKREVINGINAAGGFPGYTIKDGEVIAMYENASDMSPEEMPTPEMRQYLGVYGEKNDRVAFIDFHKGGNFMIGSTDKNGREEYVGGLQTFSEDLASKNTKNMTPSSEGSVAIAQYQLEYLDGRQGPNKQFEAILQDNEYRDLKGRMLKAFPTYMLWLIDEGGRFAGVKLFDNVYGLNSVVDFSVHTSENSIEDTLVLTVSNIYQKLTTPFNKSLVPEGSDLYETPIGQMIRTIEDRQRNLRQGMTDDLLEINSIRLKPGVRVHLRGGYGAHPSALQTLFNGVVAEVQEGDVMTIICQSDSHELTAMVNNTDTKGHSGTLQGGIDTGFWLSEPRDLIVRLLSMGSSYFKEWISWGTKGVVFSNSKFGIRHFGAMLYEEMSKQEEIAQRRKQEVTITETLTERDPDTNTGRFSSLVGPSIDKLSKLNNVTQTPGLVFDANLVRLAQYMWASSMSNRDYEIFKRNIYPGNGTGVAQFMGGDMIDAGMILTEFTQTAKWRDSQEGGIEEAQEAADAASIVSGAVNSVVQSVFDLTNKLMSEAKNADINRDVNAAMDEYKASIGYTEEAIISLLSEATTDNIDLTEFRIHKKGLLETILDNDVVKFVGLSGLAFVVGGVPILGAGLAAMISPLGYMFDDIVNDLADKQGGALGTLIQLSSYIINPRRMVRTGMRLVNSSVGQALGLMSTISDDDLKGYDEVSFRAQTYMKTVWDLCQTCARLLPNYIIAVRPFEDRSTLFYGKPHWLYTSGVIPVSAGVPKSLTQAPMFAKPNVEMEQMLREAGFLKSDQNRLMNLIDEVSDLKSVLEFTTGATDPYSLNSGDYINPDTQATIEAHLKANAAGERYGVIELTPENQKALADAFDDSFEDLSTLTPDQLNLLLDVTANAHKEPEWVMNRDGDLYKVLKDTDWYGRGDSLESVTRLIREYTSITKQMQEARAEEFANEAVAAEWLKNSVLDISAEYAPGASMEALMNKNPLAFAYNFGWKFDATPVWVDPSTGLGVDKVGDLARMMYDQDYSTTIDAIGGGRSLKEAEDIWRDFRRPHTMSSPIAGSNVPVYNGENEAPGTANTGNVQYYEDGDGGLIFYNPDTPEGQALQDAQNSIGSQTNSYYFRNSPALQDVWNRYFPNDPATGMTSSSNGVTTGQVMSPQFVAAQDLFMRFMWQDPFNRSWVIVNASRREEGLGGTLTTGLEAITPFTSDENEMEWTWEAHIQAFEVFISNKVEMVNGVPTSGATKAWMQANNKKGGSTTNWFSGKVADFTGWFDQNVGQVLSMITDTMTGFIASMRLSLAQMSNNLGAAGEFQKQANILNASFNDSIYYQLGSADSLLRLIDNPFTREYGEPVVEIREPFQRMHFVSSFDSILSNGIRENLSGVYTTVTAVSDGKYPVKVFMDKAMAPDRQVETTVETGIYWDNAMGSGLMGMFQPFIHPLETMRSYAKTATGSSDQLSSRRIALSHLKDSVKNIYDGELIVIGNPDIRPYDLVYMADVNSRMYGLFEVSSVTHHFTVDQGFITAITPNALVTVNDPARWTMLSYVWSKMANKNLRDDVRAALAVSTDMALYSNSKVLKQENAYEMFGTQINGSVQYTQGNTSIIKDIAASHMTNGVDEIWGQVAKIDVAMGGMKGASTITGGALGALTGNPVGVVAGAVGGYVVGDLLWDAWSWVKDNLLDQQGIYVQFLNKDGQPMDAGLSNYQGLAVGTNHTVDLLPNILGASARREYADENGNWRITTNDLLGSLGWSEVETATIFRETSRFVNETNNLILGLANRSPSAVTNQDFEVIHARIIAPLGEDMGDGYMRNGVIDGDTIDVLVTDGKGLVPNGIQRIRLAGINTSEINFYDNPHTPYSEVMSNHSANDMGRLAYEYLVSKFSITNNQTFVIRIDKANPQDSTNSQRYLGVVFYNAPIGTEPSKRMEVLEDIAKSNPPIAWDQFMEDGRPYTLNWELVMSGYGNVYMLDSLFDTENRMHQIEYR